MKEAVLYEKLDNNKVHCYLCSHHCRILPGKRGLCGVRENFQGTLKSLVYAEPIALAVDPIEKKPLYHFLPATKSYSLATKGCNFKCGFCQNWQISQNPDSIISFSSKKILPQDIVEEAKKSNCASISYTYTEPTIFFEYAYDISCLAKKEGLKNIFVTNGYMTKEALETISPYLDAANVDLKSFSEDFYLKNCGGGLKPVLNSIKLMHKLNIWVEITTLVIPDQNDSEKELRDIAEFIASISKEIPWHISRFHPDYKFINYNHTPYEVLTKAKNIAKSCGLKYVYLGNVSDGTDTICPNCGKILIKRDYFNIWENNIKNNRCLFCQENIAGVFIDRH
ncbi:MAG: AmmeMemoRadiSam system radical SAM enzyme [Candidatus Omnitrophica bacterium]|jgi:pyruvate formate lyase activating enzyme|nr:AmmeMemoRadiSam system radical SAM enzyme [Candidatus Omnitrophota bacterium]